MDPSSYFQLFPVISSYFQLILFYSNAVQEIWITYPPCFAMDETGFPKTDQSRIFNVNFLSYEQANSFDWIYHFNFIYCKCRCTLSYRSDDRPDIMVATK